MSRKNFDDLLDIQEKLKNFSFTYANINFWPLFRIVVGYNDNFEKKKLSKKEIEKFNELLSFKQNIGVAFFFYKEYLKLRKKKTGIYT